MEQVSNEAREWRKDGTDGPKVSPYFHAIFENSLEGIVLIRPETGEILYANPAALAMLRMTESEVREAGRDGIVVHDAALEEALKEQDRHGKWRGELTCRRKDGTVFPVELASGFIEAPDGTTISNISFRDITRGKQGEEALRESEEKYRAVVEHSNDGIIMIQDGVVKYANPRMAEIDGSTVDLLIGSSISDHIDPVDMEKVTEMHRKRIAGEAMPSVYEAVLKRRDGSRAYAELNVGMTRYQGKPAVLATIRDITDRKLMEDALRDSEERFRKLFETLPLGVGLIDPKSLHYMLFNEALPADLGYSLDEFSKITLDQIEALHDRPTIAMNHARMIMGERLQFETQLRHKYQGVREVLVTATALKMDGRRLVLSIVTDITERKRAEEALRKAHDELETRVEERTAELVHERQILQTIIDNIPVMLTFYRTTGEVVFINKEIERLLGWTWEDLNRTDVMAECYPDPEYRNEVWEFMKQPGPFWKDLTVRTRDGRLVETRWMNVKVSDEAQIGIGLDVTDQVKLEEQLRHAQKMEALGTMAGGVAHDFNNILAAVIGFAEMAKEDVPEGSANQYHLEQILKAGLRGRDLVKQMLAFSRKDGEKRKPLKLNDAIDEAIKLIRASIPTTIDIRVNIEGQSGFVLAEPTQIQQVMINLCNNAADAMNETGGILTIRLSDYEVAEKRPMTGLAPGPYMKLTVNDTGRGMDRKVLERVFEPFFTTKQPGKGTGLGLSIVHGIVTGWGGEIAVESRPNHGTTFTIYLPQIQEQSAEKDQETVTAPGGGGERVLFVDDEQALVDLGTRMIKTLGYHVTGMTSSRDSLETFRQDPAAFDLIISDQTMPELTGLQLLRELKSVRDVPFILVTGYSQTANYESAKKAGVNAFVMKPLTKGELARTIRQVLDERNSRQVHRKD